MSDANPVPKDSDFMPGWAWLVNRPGVVVAKVEQMRLLHGVRIARRARQRRSRIAMALRLRGLTFRSIGGWFGVTATRAQQMVDHERWMQRAKEVR